MFTEKESWENLEMDVSGLKLPFNDVVAFDFDELLVSTHLTREVMRFVSRKMTAGDQMLLQKMAFGKSYDEVFICL